MSPGIQLALFCRNCGTLNTDPGGDPTQYLCGVCGQPALQRLPEQNQQQSQTNSRLVAALAGAGLVGLATSNPVGALIGGIVGFMLGDRLSK